MMAEIGLMPLKSCCKASMDEEFSDFVSESCVEPQILHTVCIVCMSTVPHISQTDRRADTASRFRIPSVTNKFSSRVKNINDDE